MQRDAYESLIRGLAVLLEDWAEWQASYSGVRGFPAKSTMLKSGGASQTFEELMEGVDNAVHAAIDAAVDDLLPAQRAAIMRRYGIAAVFRFQRDDYADCLQQAHDRLLVVLPKKGVDIPMR